VNKADQPAIVHVTHDVLNGIKGHTNIGLVMHSEEDACNQLQHQRDACQ